MAFAIATKWSLIVNQTLQESLEEGFALPVWGLGKNKISDEARQWLIKIFNDGQKSRPAIASNVVILMQGMKNLLGEPMFDKDSYLDEDQIKSLFSAFSRGKKRLLEEEQENLDNSEEKQEEEEAFGDRQLLENAVLANEALNEVEEDLKNDEANSDSHPITHEGLDYCAIARSILKKLSPLDRLTKVELRSIVTKIDAEEILTQDLAGVRKRKKTLTRLGSSLVDYIRQQCWCCLFQ